MNLGDEFTLAMWVKIPSDRSNIQTIIANGNSGSNADGFKMMVNSYGTTDRTISFETGDGSNSAITRTNPNLFQFDRWNYVALIVNRSTGSARIYYNGTDMTATTGKHTGFKTNDVIRLGQMTNSVYKMKGQIDHIDIFARQLSVNEIVSAMNDSEPPSVKAPTGLSYTSANSQVTLSWKDNADNETGFVLERSLSASTGFTVIKTLSSNQTSFTDAQVTAGATYFYRVKAVQNTISSSFSNTVSTVVSLPAPLLHRISQQGM